MCVHVGNLRVVVAYDWDIICAQRNAEEGYYRLLGEMLHRRATASDLQRIREFLSARHLGPDVWLSLGEGLFCTTGGASVGYRMWAAWSRCVLANEFDEAHQLEAWGRFQTSSSDGLEVSSEPREQPYTALVDEHDRTQRTGLTSRVTRTAQDPAAAIRLIPGGGHTVRLFGHVFEGVDEFELLDLLQAGVFFELEILFGVRWVPVATHPGFTTLVQQLRDEAMAQLATTERVRPEVTQPGSR